MTADEKDLAIRLQAAAFARLAAAGQDCPADLGTIPVAIARAFPQPEAPAIPMPGASTPRDAMLAQRLQTIAASWLKHLNVDLPDTLGRVLLSAVTPYMQPDPDTYVPSARARAMLNFSAPFAPLDFDSDAASAANVKRQVN